MAPSTEATTTFTSFPPAVTKRLGQETPMSAAEDRDTSNKRDRERMTVNLPVLVSVSGESGTLEEASISRDISSQGIYCFLRKPLPPGLQVEVRLAGSFENPARKLPGDRIPAEVVRNDYRKGFGLQGVAL